MASPTVETTSTSSENSFTSSHTVTLPSGISNGDLIIVNFVADNVTNGVTFPVGWTEFFNLTNTARMHIAYRLADGTEGSTITVTTGFTRRSAHVCYRITEAQDPATTAPEPSSGATGAGTAPNPDSLTPAGGSKDYLWMALIGSDTNYNVSSNPTNYINRTTVNAGTGTVSAGGATRELTASSENPNSFQGSPSGNWVAVTVAIYPAEAPTGFTRKVKISGTFEDKPIKTKVSGSFEDKQINIRVGGSFQEA